MYIVGLDIGTTSLCAAVIDSATGEPVKCFSSPGPGFLPSSIPYERIQDPKRIWEEAQGLLAMTERECPLAAIGVTGQMHGILYLDRDGEPLSPLYTWQDGSGGQSLLRSGGRESCAEFLTRHSSLPVRPGYGASTYLCHLERGQVPTGSRFISTIHDWIVMKLSSRTQPLIHPTDGASLGMFCLETGEFERQAIHACGMEPSFFPEVAKEPVCGMRNGRIPVTVAIGDNQASFLGSAGAHRDAVLVNVGTGSQVSFRLSAPRSLPVGEVRPFIDGDFLAVGSSLCGGRAYAILESFFRQGLEMAGIPAEQPLYRQMEDAARRAKPPFPQFSTLFCGTREEPDQRAAISQLSEENFTPGHLIYSGMQGIADELFQLYRGMGGEAAEVRQLTGSGNGLRKNKLLQNIFEETFGLPLQMTPYQEEAAVGAALFAARSCGYSL